MAIPWGLTLLQGEMGSVLVMIFVFGVMMFFGGIRIRTLVGIVAAGAIGLALLYGFTMASGSDSYRLTRILSFLSPELVDESATYQVTQSKIAIGSRRAEGRGHVCAGQLQPAGLRARGLDGLHFLHHRRGMGLCGLRGGGHRLSADYPAHDVSGPLYRRPLRPDGHSGGDGDAAVPRI